MRKPDFGYQEINQLNDFFIKYKFSTRIDRSEVLGSKIYYPKVNFTLLNQQFYLFVDDEYDDLKKNYPLLNLCLILRELEGYEYASDYEIWCQERYFDISDDKIKSNFNHLKQTYKEIKNIVIKIESYVSDYDFEMNAGAAQKLRR